MPLERKQNRNYFSPESFTSWISILKKLIFNLKIYQNYSYLCEPGMRSNIFVIPSKGNKRRAALTAFLKNVIILIIIIVNNYNLRITHIIITHLNIKLIIVITHI